MNLETLLDEIIELQYSFQGTLRNSEEHRKKLKEILCFAFERQCDDVFYALEKHSKDWQDTRGTSYNPYGPPAEVPITDRVIDLIINRTKKDLNEMSNAFKKERGGNPYDY
jgi:hypothetical protein